MYCFKIHQSSSLFLPMPVAAHTAAPRGDGQACHGLGLPPEVSLLPPGAHWNQRTGRGVAGLGAGVRHGSVLQGGFRKHHDLLLILGKQCLWSCSRDAEKERGAQHRVKARFSLNRWYFRWPHYSRRINFLENPIHICAYAVLAGGLPEMAKTQELIFFWPE